MISSAYEDYRKELMRYNHMIVYAVIKKYYPADEELPYYSLDIEIETIPKTDEEIEKYIATSLYSSRELETIVKYFDNAQKMI